MATKTLTITEDAYERLAALKNETDSFSDIITKLTGKVSLLSVAGILSEEEGTILEKNIEKLRRTSTERLRKIRREISS